ncbi:hypothetical protein DNU06_03350 [Putridiphycobacter roseus]|uniref:VWA domain-containing protein n=1 Tax=Putridiphycobacter roseus TaxID=2219161 RepID=A0A2W1N2I0_9FLAO|nr:hypothetical protein [Putridiphycobacter roseus]PZE18879.1 hypothetical protein DNU06_03350 [Putridiphycobacter roseus]
MQHFFTCILVFSTFLSFSQSEKITQILKQEREQIERVETIQSDKITYISSDFAGAKIKTINLRDKVKKLEVLKVYYVYTAYKRSQNFDQFGLDQQRFNQLSAAYPELFESNQIEWEILEQTKLNDYTKGDNYFHGFIIVHRPLLTETNRTKEIQLINQYFDHPNEPLPFEDEDPIAATLNIKESTDVKTEHKGETVTAAFQGGDQALFEHIQRNLTTPADVWQDRKDIWVKFDLSIAQNGEVGKIDFKEKYSKEVQNAIASAVSKMPKWEPKTLNEFPVKDTVQFEWRVSYSPTVKGLYLKNGKAPVLDHTTNSIAGASGNKETVSPLFIQESPVFKAFDSISIPGKMALVMDVTGSMQNNIVSVCYWLKQHENNLPFSSFTAFNDGDGMKDNLKEIGSTKGIYYTGFYAEYPEIIKTAMLNGNGGDFPENDIESILHAVHKDHQATAVLLIADNMSEIKDIELLKQIDLPVSILPCGLTFSIQQHYLDLAYQTGGKIYYANQVIDLSQIKKGDTFQIKKATYLFNGKTFEIKK